MLTAVIGVKSQTQSGAEKGSEYAFKRGIAASLAGSELVEALAVDRTDTAGEEFAD